MQRLPGLSICESSAALEGRSGAIAVLVAVSSQAAFELAALPCHAKTLGTDKGYRSDESIS
jgi:hypothetical protein